jgi:stearoyl-CoA desaturase (delta-9 desaturase)
MKTASPDLLISRVERRPWLAPLAYYAVMLVPFAVSIAVLVAVQAGSGVDLHFWFLLPAILFMRQINGFAMAIYFHRSASHDSIRFAPWFTTVLRVIGWLAIGLGARTYVAVHRWHHASTDTKDDPHSPTRPGGSLANIALQDARSFWTVAWDRGSVQRFIKGTPDDALERFINGEEKRLFGFAGVRALVIFGVPAALFYFAAGLPLEWALLATWGWFVAVAGSLMAVASFGINGIAHMWGYRNFDIDNTSTNIIARDFLSWGETLHHNHHAHPGRANLAIAPGELDAAWPVLQLMQRLGLVTKLAA